MLNLTIKQLTEITRGELSFGSMPPLDGSLQEIGRMIPGGEKVLDGDVVAIGGTLGLQPEGFSESAYMQGAQGVICSRHVTPWDGGFAIRVPCVRTAIAEVARWQRTRFDGLMVAVISEDEASQLVEQLAIRCSARPAVCGPGGVGDLMWALLDLDATSAVEVVQLRLANCCDQSLSIAAPDVIVVPPSGESETLDRDAAETLSIDVGLSMLSHFIHERTTLVLPRSATAWRKLGENRGASISVCDEPASAEALIEQVAALVNQTVTEELESA